MWRFGMVIGKPTFVPVKDLEMGFEKMVKIAQIQMIEISHQFNFFRKFLFCHNVDVHTLRSIMVLFSIRLNYG
jgi:hypothetical protein